MSRAFSIPTVLIVLLTVASPVGKPQHKAQAAGPSPPYLLVDGGERTERIAQAKSSGHERQAIFDAVRSEVDSTGTSSAAPIKELPPYAFVYPVTFSRLFRSSAPFMLGVNLRPGSVNQTFDGLLDVWWAYSGARSQDDVRPLMQAAPVTTFADVPFDHPYHDEIETLYQAGYTAGCGTDPLIYCPDQTMTRGESSVYVERGIHHVDVDPPQPGSQVFGDVSLDQWFARWVQALWDDGYTAGCQADPRMYCPFQGYTRAEGAVLYLRMLFGADYGPPPAEGLFDDVPIDWWGARWVEAAYDEGILPRCGANPMRACPDDPLTRGLSAYMVVLAKGLDASPPPATSCLSQPGALITLEGVFGEQFGERDLAPNTKIDARAASFLDAADYPIVLRSGDNLCFSGGTIVGYYPPNSTWDRMHSTAGMELSNANLILENTRIHNYGDGVRLKSGVNAFTIRGVHFSYIRDDCVENDWLYPGLVEDVLFDGCYTGFSARPEESGVDGRANVLTIRNSLIRMQPMEKVYKDRGLIPGHGGFFKWDTSSGRLSPMLSLHGNIFRADQPSNSSLGLGIPPEKLERCSDNIMVWLGEGPFPDPLPDCFSITTDVAVWNDAVADWLARH